MNKRIIATTAATASLALASVLIAAPALAVPYVDANIVIGDYTWDINQEQFEINDTQYYNETTSVDLVDAWDDSSFTVWDDEVSATSDEVDCLTADLAAADSNGDIVISCADEMLAVGISAAAEIRLYGEGDLARFLVTLTNDTDDAIDYSWQYYVDFGNTNYRATSGTPTLGENAYADSDFWVYNDQTGGFDAAVVWGVDGAAVQHEQVDDSSNDQLYIWSDADDDSQNTLAAGDSITFVFFQKVDAVNSVDLAPDAAPASGDVVEPAVIADPATFMAEFSSLSGRLARGIDPSLNVGNWLDADEPADGEEPELAATGASAQSLGLGIAGGLTLLLGAGLLALRTTRRSSTSTI